jgi:hypothetical protein|tara:strand:- start:708 stop:1061 length:354 start_codon:yes stop_codon:yes gene_type:complete
MSSCPNIGGDQVRYRKVSGYVSLASILIFIPFIFIFDIGVWKILIFFPTIVMTISLFEASNKTCIVYSSIGIKHMGEKYERERNIEFLKKQRIQSFKIVLSGLAISLLLTYLVYLIP